MAPLVSLRRRTARLPTARPSASMWRPVSVVSAMANPAPRERKSAIALSIARALSGSSQVPKASARRGTGAAVTSEASPKISGSSPVAGHTTITCGSDRSRALARSTSAFSAMISARAAASLRSARARVRTSMTAVTVAKKMTPRVSASAAIS